MLDVPGPQGAAGFGWQGLAKSIFDALRLPNNVSVLLPATTNARYLLEALDPLLKAAVIEHEYVSWLQDGDDDVFTTLALHATENWSGSCASLEDLVKACSEHGRDVNIVMDLTLAEPTTQEQMAEFIERWAREVQALPKQEAWPRIVLLFSYMMPGTLKTDAFLQQIPAWTITWASGDIGVWNGHLVNRPEDEKLWLRCVLPELAAFDDTLPDELKVRQIRSFASLLESLQQLAEHREWKGRIGSLQSQLSRVPCSGTVLPTGYGSLPAQLQSLWHAGMLGLVAGRGWDLHAGILALVSPEDALRYRVWRGQTAVLMPILEHLRRWAEKELRRDYGNKKFEEGLTAVRSESLSKKNGASPDSDEMPTLRELGGLARDCGNSWGLWCIKCHVDIRNELAHGRPVEPKALNSLLNLAAAAAERTEEMRLAEHCERLCG